MKKSDVFVAHESEYIKLHVMGHLCPWLDLPEPVIVSKSLLSGKDTGVPSVSASKVHEILVLVIDPARDAPVLIGDNLIDAGGVGGVGGLRFERVAQLMGTENDPVVVVAAVEPILYLTNGEEQVWQVAFVGKCDEGCPRRWIS